MDLSDTGLRSPAVGSSWSIQATPSPADASASELAAVSCTSATSCTAAGDDEDGDARVTLAKHWNGSAWSIQAVPVPAGVTVGPLSDVSYWSPAKCIAAGDVIDRSGNGRLLAESWNGST